MPNWQVAADSSGNVMIFDDIRLDRGRSCRYALTVVAPGVGQARPGAGFPHGSAAWPDRAAALQALGDAVLPG
jgi:hypothetical protein